MNAAMHTAQPMNTTHSVLDLRGGSVMSNAAPASNQRSVNISADERAYRDAMRHTRRVRALKVLIPLGALLGVAGVLFASFYRPLATIEGVSVQNVTLAGTKITMEKPRLTGFRGKDSRPYEVTAVSASQDVRTPNVVELTTLRAIVTENNGKTNLEADFGVYDTQKEHINLKDNVRVRTDSGYDVKLSSAFVDFKGGSVVSKEPVRVDFSGGSIQADRLDITDSGQRMVFEGRVHTVFSVVEADSAKKASSSISSSQ
jgi:lipopolysaccharide export system protein LptC